jgi:hypothetical protein
MTFAVDPDQVDASSIDMTATTASDPTGPVEYLFTFNACPSNGGTGGTTSSWQESTSYADTGLQANKCYGYTVQARDSKTPTPNTGTASGVSYAYTAANVPGTPTLGNATDSTLDLSNDENGNPAASPTTNFAVQVVTTNPSDSTWLGKWVDSSGNPSDTEVWMSDATLDALTLQGLQEGTTYGVKVKARNEDGDETALSAEGQGETTDNITPAPDPMTFAVDPDQVDASSIDMTATTASDPSTPVEYLFTFNACPSNAGTGGTTSSWQESTSYTDTGLQTNKCYGYTVQARDSATPTPNTGTASGVSYAYTAANVPGTPTLGNASGSTLDLTNDENGNPAASPTTNFAVQVVTTNPSDSTWLNKWVDSSGDPSDTEVWMSDATLDALTLQGLQKATTYGVKVKARNEDGDETALSAEGQGSTIGSLSTLHDTGGSVQISFNNVLQSTTTPRFRVSATPHKDFDTFFIELNTQADFGGSAYTKTFSGTYTSGIEYNLFDNLSPELPGTDGVTYYVRARASEDGGSTWGDWSSGTWSFTHNGTAGEDPVWFQTTDGQFDTGTLTDTLTSGSDSVQIDEEAGTIQVPTSCYDGDFGANTRERYTQWTIPGSGTVTVTQLWYWAKDGTLGSIVGMEIPNFVVMLVSPGQAHQDGFQEM